MQFAAPAGVKCAGNGRLSDVIHAWNPRLLTNIGAVSGIFKPVPAKLVLVVG
jgi:hypothetical protein